MNTAVATLKETPELGLGSQLAADLIERARALHPVLKERAVQANREIKVPTETIDDFEKAGFFRILQSKQYGGYELEPQVFYAVVLEVAKACMSSAWALSVIGVHNWQMNLFDAKASEEVWGKDTTVRISSSYAPVGQVERVEGGFKLSGRWSFSSGCEHCDWVFLGAVIPTEEGAWEMENYRTFLLPKKDYEIVKNWDVVGLKGTGSHDIVVEGAIVPEYRTHFMMEDVTSDRLKSKPASYRLPFMQVFSRAVCTATLGALEGALTEFIQIAQFRIAGTVMMHEDPTARRIAAQVKSEIESLKLVMYANFDKMLAAAHEGVELDMTERARFRYESAVVADRCINLSAKMLKAAGSGAIRNNSQLLARHLDMLASQAHIANVSEPFEINLGGVLFGHESTELGL